MDRPEAARHDLFQALARLDAVVGDGPSRSYVGAARILGAWRRAEIEMYAGNPRAACDALRRYREEWWETPLMQWSGFNRTYHEIYEARAFAALAIGGSATAAELARAEELARRHAKSNYLPLRECALCTLGGLALHNGDITQALGYLNRSLERLAPACPMLAACSRMQIGRIQGGADGEQLCRDAELALRAEGIVDPRRWANMWTFPL